MTHRIATSTLAASVDPVAGTLALWDAGSQTPFAQGRLRAAVCAVEAVPGGQALRIRYLTGDSDLLSVVPGLPFVLIQPFFVAGVMERPEILRLALDLGPGPLAVLGTGGLATPAAAPASYAWMALAHPGTQDGVVAGWLTQERASGVVACAAAEGGVLLTARSEYGRLVVPAGGEVAGEVLAVGAFADADHGLEAWATEVARRLDIRLPAMPAVYCTWYADVHGGAGDAASTAELSAFAAIHLKPFGLSCIQVDDGWQVGKAGNGPRKDFRTHDPAGPYAGGIRAMADGITGHGLTAGLWLLPFGGTWDDPAFGDEMFVRGPDGRPFDTRWGGTCLDMTHPVARARVHDEVARITGAWGCRYLKIDGLYTGAGVRLVYATTDWLEDHCGETRFHDPAASNLDAFRSGLRLVRAAATPGTFILGCCAPQNMRSYAGSFGLVDAMRTGHDNAATWEAWSASSPLEGAIHHHLNGRIWWNDPDPLYVRATLPLASARCIASWHALSGHMLSLSDWLPQLPAERLDLLKRILPAHGVSARMHDRYEHRIPGVWQVSDERPGRQRRDVVGLFNWDAAEAPLSVDLDRLGQPAGTDWAVFDFWDDVLLPPARGLLTLPVAGHGCRVLALRPLLDRPFLLSTSRHVSQGIVEVVAEDWDADAGVLAGRSDLVAGDACELRVHAAGRRLLAAEADGAAVEVVAVAAEEGLVRVRLQPAAGGMVDWRLRWR